MPQFNFQMVFWPQLVWLAVFFTILYFGIVGPTLPKLGRVVTEREGKINGDIDSAAAAKAKADALGTDYAAGITAAQDAARARLNQARSESSAAIEAQLSAANARLEADAAAAKAALDTARAQALAEIEAVAGEAAADIVEKLTGVRPAPEAAAAATRAALA